MFIITFYTSTNVWPIFQCVMHIMRLVWQTFPSQTNIPLLLFVYYRPPDKSKIREFTIKLNDILSSTSQSDHVFIVVELVCISNGSFNLI